MANTPTNVLGNLDFEDIKSSLIEYLRNQSIIKDYNYEGSAIRALVDLLAYNTFYYAYYMNMVSSEMFLDSAQRLDSIISLTKPLGYTVAGKRSARATIQVTGIDQEDNSSFPELEYFYGINEDGIEYVFRNLNSGVVYDSDVIIEITEGQLVNDTSAITSFDFEKQRYLILNENIDMSTIQVKVNDEIWSLSGNIGTPFRVDDKIYFVERLSTGGFIVQFGIENSLGVSIEDGDVLKIRYMVSSGTKGNNIYQFRAGTPVAYTPGNLNVGVSCDECNSSAGGLDQPNINLIKFLAPKLFSSQGRAVTKSDYMGLLLDSKLIDSVDQISIFGGDELQPPKYGRVFVSIADTSLNPNTIISYLKEYSVITVLPEYVSPVYNEFLVDVKFTYKNVSPTPTQKLEAIKKVKNKIQESIEYNKFNFTFDSFEISNSIMKQYDDISISADRFDIKFRKYILTNIDLNRSSETNINLGSPFKLPFLGSTPISTEFSNIYGVPTILKVITGPTTSFDNYVKIKGFNLLTGLEDNSLDYGRILINKGIIYIADIASVPFTITLPMSEKILQSKYNNINNIYISTVASL